MFFKVFLVFKVVYRKVGLVFNDASTHFPALITHSVFVYDFHIFILTALITVLANDDGPGVLSFNNSEHFFLREPTALYVQESVAVLYIVREPAQGLFGTVTVQFIVTKVNSSVESKDLTPSKGYIVLEEGVRFKVQYEPSLEMNVYLLIFTK